MIIPAYTGLLIERFGSEYKQGTTRTFSFEMKMAKYWRGGISPAFAAIACIAIIFSGACGFQLQTQPSLHGVGEVEITGKLDPEFRQVLLRTIEDSRGFDNGELVDVEDVAFELNFVATNESITHLRFDQFREPLQSELAIECKLSIKKGDEPPTEEFLVDTHRFNYSRDFLLAVTTERQEAREAIYREFARRIVMLLAELTEGSPAGNSAQRLEAN